MLELKDIRKSYVTAGFTQVALDGVSLAFRDNEFVAVLGASGSGKTTMLNILGGLDHADSGDIVINGISTKGYSDKDWDTYRNHRIGFIFQSYNLIPHQTVLSNVELALTLAGVSSAERRERACAALERVGLSDHINKRPNQLSGGQMQRVAIARALVNDPDIVLADEPTGALDTETGIQVMDLLKEIADERLVIMVTHNPELAESYATRIVRLQDGSIVDDSDPIVAALPERPTAAFPHRDEPKRHASMSLLTALSLSFNNLMTKKGRTFMTAFAGSIGIIGIAAILALSNGVNDYIAKTEEDTLASYPLTITKSSFDLTSLMMARIDSPDSDADNDKRLIKQSSVMSDMFAQVKSNDLKSFRTFLMSKDSGIDNYVNSVQYSYGIQPIIYKAGSSQEVTQLNPSPMNKAFGSGFASSSFMGGSSMSSFNELVDDERLLSQSLELVDGRWPQSFDEAVLVLGPNGAVTDYTLYSLGVYDIKVMDDMTTKALSGEEVTVPDAYQPFSYDDALSMHFTVLPAAKLYRKNVEQNTWTDMSSDSSYLRTALASQDAIDLQVVGVVKQREGGGSATVPEGIGYLPSLTLQLMENAQGSDIVKEQLANSSRDVFTGETFEDLKKRENRDFDLKDAFKVDEDALRQAFSFDASAFSNLGEGMDLSSLDLESAFSDLDLSDADLSSMDFSSMDFSNMDLSGVDMSSLSQLFDADSMRSAMTSIPAYTGQGLDADAVLPDFDLESILAPAAGKLVDGFADWVVSSGVLGGSDGTIDAVSLVSDYLKTDEARATLSSLEKELTSLIGPERAKAVTDAVEKYFVEELAPYLQGAFEKLDPATVTEEEIRAILDGAPTLDLKALGELAGIDAIMEAASKTANELSTDFAAFIIANPSLVLGDGENDPASYGEVVERYLNTDSARSIVDGLGNSFGTQVQQSITSAVTSSMQSYLANDLTPYFTNVLSQQMEGIGEKLGAELGKVFLTQMTSQMSGLSSQLGSALSTQISSQMGDLSSSLSDAFTLDESAFTNAFSIDTAAFANAIQFNMTQDDLRSLLTNLMNADELSYEANLSKLGYGEKDSPELISIYPKDFEAKEEVLKIIDAYNDRMVAAGKEDSAIQYTDIMGMLMSSVTDIVNTISLVLIAFVSISLVVSSIMISIITYISVLERKKEIGILRAMGASKFNVANIFNAETVLEGLFAGVLAVAVVYAVSVPVNELVYRLKDVPNIMQLKPENALALIAISVFLTLVAGIIPSSAASRRDPVEALRSE